ncbi:MAG: DUF1298 domain-containing protein [Mycobacterium sp.]
MSRLAAVDAQTYWLSAKVPNDQFLLYAFDGAPPVEPVVELLRRRASMCHDLQLRILDDRRTAYPAWVRASVAATQLVIHAGCDWAGCLNRVTALADDQVDPTAAAWRLHVFTPVVGVPGAIGPATVAVLQISHALADGTRSADLAGWLFGRPAPVTPIAGPARGSLLARSVAAARTHRQLLKDIEAGVLVAAPAPRPALLANSAPAGARRVATLIRGRDTLGGPTVTVSVLAAVSTALAGFLGDRGQDTTRLAAEVPIAHSGIRHAHNHFRNIGVALRPELAVAERAERIAAELSAGRVRGQHPATVAARHAQEAVPAALLRWGVGRFDETARAPEVTGHTVLTSVNRGAADLRFGTAPVLFTSGYPALSPMMSLVHGVNGVGETVTVSVHAAESAGDIDEYVDRLDHALG